MLSGLVATPVGRVSAVVVDMDTLRSPASGLPGGRFRLAIGPPSRNRANGSFRAFYGTGTVADRGQLHGPTEVAGIRPLFLSLPPLFPPPTRPPRPRHTPPLQPPKP